MIVQSTPEQVRPVAASRLMLIVAAGMTIVMIAGEFDVLSALSSDCRPPLPAGSWFDGYRS